MTNYCTKDKILTSSAKVSVLSDMTMTLNYRNIIRFIFVLVAVILFLHATSWMYYLPLGMRFTLAATSLCVCPGFTIFSLMVVRRQISYDFLTIFLISCSLSFSYNFIINIMTFLMGWSLSEVIYVHLGLVLLLIGSLLMIIKQPGNRLIETTFNIKSRSALAVAAVLLLAVCTYLFLPSGFYIEELMTMRKLVDNTQIGMKNIGYMPGESTTYLFVPFYLMMGMVSKLCGTDVVATISMTWSVVAVISLLSLVQISFLLTQSRFPGVIITAVYLIHIFFYVHYRSDSFVGIPPSPDRYGFSEGGLLLLCTFHFLVHMRDQRTNPAAFLGLIYLIIEIAFVHAREALYMISFICIFLLLALAQRERYQIQIRRCLILILICGGILYSYKLINLAFVPDLQMFISQMKSDISNQILDSVRLRGIFWTLAVGPDVGSNYANNLQRIGMSPGIRFAFVVLLCLPIYVKFRRDLFHLFLPLVLTCLGVVSMTGLRSFISYMIGSIYLFEFAGVIALLSLVIYADMIDSCATWLKRWWVTITWTIIGDLRPWIVRMTIFFLGFVLLSVLQPYWERYLFIASSSMAGVLSDFPETIKEGVVNVVPRIIIELASAVCLFMFVQTILLRVRILGQGRFRRIISFFLSAAMAVTYCSWSVNWFMSNLTTSLRYRTGIDMTDWSFPSIFSEVVSLGITPGVKGFLLKSVIMFGFPICLIVLVLMIISVKQERRLSSVLGTRDSFLWKRSLERGYLGKVIIGLLIALAMGVVEVPGADRSRTLDNSWSPGTFSREPVESLRQLSESGFLNLDSRGTRYHMTIAIDSKVLTFIRVNIPAHSVWLSASTIPLMLACNQYAPIMTYEGAYALDFSKNDIFMEKYSTGRRFSLAAIMKDERKYHNIISQYNVNYLWIVPGEYESCKAIWQQAMKDHFYCVYDDGSHLILRVNEL